MFAEASYGNLQNYLDKNHDLIGISTRKKWCRQLTEAKEYLHNKDVIHSDFRPENCLVHKSHTFLDILLGDLGGSICPDLAVDGRGLPDPPFWDLAWKSMTGTDIFSLGSMFYTIMTGYWPYKSNEASEEEDNWQYEERVVSLLEQVV